jgi:fucose 4-O-acetylase-like acetyltransferase
MKKEKVENFGTQRIEFIDLLKGFAIFCVLWGHSIQYLRDGYDFFHDPVFEFIYSFHMPLFFMISGFFFKSSLKLNAKEFLCKKMKQLLLPCFVWACLFMCFRFGKSIYTENSNFDWIQEFNTLIIPFRWPFWFLKELFKSYAIVFFSYKVLKKEWIAFVLSICLVLLSPYQCSMQRFLLPLFWLGIYLKNHYQFVLKYSKWILGISGLAFGLCLLFWNGDYTIYRTSFDFFSMRNLNFSFVGADIAFFRFLIGATGSIFWFTLFQRIYKKTRFCLCAEKIGTQTLSVYILQFTVLENIINRILDFPTINSWVYNLLVTPLVAFLALAICLGIIKIIKNKYLKLFLFGSLERK